MISDREFKIISYLRQNARATLTNLSKKTGIPISTIYDKLKQHDGNLIKRHTTLLDFSKLGFDTRVNIIVKVEKEKKEECRSFLLNNHNINSVFKINNGYDFLIEAIFSSMAEFEDFREKIDEKFNVQEMHSYYIIDEIKREAFMTDPLLLNLEV